MPVYFSPAEYGLDHFLLCKAILRAKAFILLHHTRNSIDDSEIFDRAPKWHLVVSVCPNYGHAGEAEQGALNTRECLQVVLKVFHLACTSVQEIHIRKLVNSIQN